MDAQTTPPRRPSLMEALGLARPDATGAAAAGSGSGSAAGSVTGGAAGADDDAAAGLGVDEFVDPLAGTEAGAEAGSGAGRDGSSHTDMKHLPGNALNMVEMFQLRERNHVLVQK